MDYIGSEISHKIRSAIKAKLMELGAYVDEELPEYIMVMVANKRAKSQMDGDLQLFLGNNTSQFTSWLYQVLQKLQEVTVGNLDKKSAKTTSSSGLNDSSTTKRKSSVGSESDSHRKEKRRKSSESKKSKKSELEKSKENKKDLSLTKTADSEKGSRSVSKEFVSSSRLETSDSLVSSSVDGRVSRKVSVKDKDKSEKLRDSDVIRRNIGKSSLSNGSSKVDEKNYLSRLRAEALRSREERLAAMKLGETDLLKHVASAKHLTDTNPPKTIYSQPARTKIILMHSDDEDEDDDDDDDEDDDEDFINIKADAEAEQLLKEELETALETSLGTPEQASHSSEPAATTSKKSPEGPVLPPELPTIPLKVNLVPKRPLLMEAVADPAPTPSAPAVPVAADVPAPTAPSRLQRKRPAAVEPIAMQPKIHIKEEPKTPPENPVSIKDRLGVRKTLPVPAARKEVESRTVTRSGVRSGAGESNPKTKSLSVKANVVTTAATETTEQPKKQQRSRGLLSRVVMLQNRPDARDRLSAKTEEDEEYDPSNPAVGSVASVIRVKPRPKLPAALQANKKLILKAVAEAQRSVANVTIRPEHGKQWKRTSSGLVRRRENNVAVALPKRHQSFDDTDDGLEEVNCGVTNQRGSGVSVRFPICEEAEDRELKSSQVWLAGRPSRFSVALPDIKPDSTRLVSSLDDLNNKIVIKVSSQTVNEEVPPDSSQEATRSQSAHDLMSDEEILQFHDDEGLGMEEADTLSSGRSVYPPVGLASRMPCERSNNQQLQEQQFNNPQFLVTLDGLDPSMFGSRAASFDEQVKDEYEMDVDNSETLESSPKKMKTPIVYKDEPSGETTEPSSLPKTLERCKYWPTCRLGVSCGFHHPITPCKSFPKCPFGDKCLYVHPLCKFNSSCTRRDCPFVHGGLRTLSGPVVPKINTVVKQSFFPVCKYFPKCSNAGCRFLHPKACRYGKFCSKQDCNYIHQDIPSVDKLKWTSPFKS